MLQHLWHDDCGALIATEWILAATILVLGSITGLTSLRNAVLAPLHDFAAGMGQLRPSAQMPTDWQMHNDSLHSLETTRMPRSAGLQTAQPCD